VAALAAAEAGGAASLGSEDLRERGALTACSGRFLLPAESPSVLPPTIALAATTVSLGDVCDAQLRRGRLDKRGQVVKARWSVCGDARAIRLRGRISADCTVVRGVLRRRGAARTRFVAAQSICGDGRVDARGGESCEDGNVLGGDECEPNCRICDASAGPYPTTWAGVQANVFTRAGCLSCHDADRSGGLDLRPDVAWANLVGVPSGTLPNVALVVPGDVEGSVLWRKIAKGTFGGDDDLAGGGMPLSGFRVAPDELSALGAWIAAGAPEAGVVPGTALLLQRCRLR
jgi:cysteine-rich repeat protein